MPSHLARRLALIAAPVVLLMALAACKPVPPRVKELERLYPGGFGVLPLESKKAAVQFGTGTMRAFDIIGFGIYSDPEGLNQLQAEVMAPMKSLSHGSPEELKAYQAAEKVFEAIHYESANVRNHTGFADETLNRLLRVNKEPARDPARMGAGLRELLIDYLELVDKDVVANARWIEENSK